MEQELKWFHEAARVAASARCLRARCGAVIVSENIIVGEGYNAPPMDDEVNSKCLDVHYDRAKKPKYDLTCCVHAEWRAIMNTLKTDPRNIGGATLYYVRLGDDLTVKPSGAPFCTACSRLALDVGLARFGLLHADGMTLYDTKDYNDRSYAYHKH